MLISGDVARLAESVAGRRLYPELIGIEHPRRHGGFYLYSNFDSHREHLADARSIYTGTDLATTLLEQYGIATLPASAFGESDETLAPRLATSQLYGDSDHKSETALSHPHPATLPWIKDHLQILANSLTTLTTTPQTSSTNPTHPHANAPSR